MHVKIPRVGFLQADARDAFNIFWRFLRSSFPLHHPTESILITWCEISTWIISHRTQNGCANVSAGPASGKSFVGLSHFQKSLKLVPDFLRFLRDCSLADSERAERKLEIRMVCMALGRNSRIRGTLTPSRYA